MKEKVLFDGGPTGLDLGAKRLERAPDFGDVGFRRALCGELRRMDLQDSARFGECLDVVAVQVEEVADQPFEGARAEACDHGAALGKGLEDAVELELAKGL